MPYKESIRKKVESNSAIPIKKSKYKVVNWSTYNKSLQKRGKLSLYFPKGDLRSQFINDDSYSKGMPGRTALYSGAYIEIIFIHYRLFGWGMRQITDNFVSDIVMQESLVPEDISIDKIIADGGYYSIDGVERLYLNGITPVIPPPCDAVIRGKPDSVWHDKIVSYIKTKGTVYAFHKKYGYGLRALIEAQFSRIKCCIGSSLLTENDTSKKAEGIIIGNIINLWNSFGRCESVKIG